MIDPADLRDVFDRAASLPPQDRAAFLDRACGENVALREQVERLLAADARRGIFASDSSQSGDSSSGPNETTIPALGPGTRLGPYVVGDALGAGGMGVVYKARDTRLDRTVAIKVLAENLVGSLDARQRFEREARAAAALAHPHICRLLDIGRQGDIDYLVMEYLQGETLAARLTRGRLPLRQALSIGIQISDALGTAHRVGIVHRDLKPGNILLTTAGAVLLDFGLARQVHFDEGDGGTATVDRPITRTGVILGTVQYMAPEQLQGQPVDARTDIFALGLVLYEMVTGRRAFEGSTHASVIANILRGDPLPMTAGETIAPASLDRVVRKCLAKESSERWQTASDVQARLEAIDDISGDRALEAPSPAVVSATQRYLRPVAGLVALGFLAAGAAGWMFYRDDTGHSASVVGRTVQHTLTRLTFGDLDGFGTFSPDGRFVVYQAADATTHKEALWVRPVAGGNLVQITSPNADTYDAEWSPDGNSIVFTRRGEGIFEASALGGHERRLSTFGNLPHWSPDGSRVMFAGEDAPTKLFVVTPGQPPQQILESFLKGGEWAFAFSTWYPDGRVTIIGRHRTEGLGIFTISPDDGRWVKTSLSSEAFRETGIDPQRLWVPVWAPSGDRLYVSAGTTINSTINVWRLRMDSQLQISAAERITTGPGADWWPRLSNDGKKLLFTIITGDSRLWSFPLDSKSGTTGLPQPVSEEDGIIHWASLSPDGRKLVYYYEPLGTQSQDSELRLVDSPFSGSGFRIAAGQFVRFASAWSHQGNRLALSASENRKNAAWGDQMLLREPDGTERVVGACSSSATEKCSLIPVDWAPGDNAILAASRSAGEGKTRLTLWAPSPDAPSTQPQDVVVSDKDINIFRGRYSPDGKWLAFAYGAGFHEEKGLAVVPAHGRVPRSEWHSVAEGFEGLGNPEWSADGRYLYFTSSHNTGGYLNVWRVAIAPTTGLPTATPAAVTSLNSIGFFLLNRSWYPKIALGADRLILPMNSQKAAVWMLDNVDR